MSTKKRARTKAPAVQMTKAQEFAAVDASLTVSDGFLAVGILAERLDIPDVTADGISIRLLLLAISKAGMEASTTMHGLLFPDSGAEVRYADGTLVGARRGEA